MLATNWPIMQNGGFKSPKYHNQLSIKVNVAVQIAGQVKVELKYTKYFRIDKVFYNSKLFI